jgi:hypothetical protein
VFRRPGQSTIELRDLSRTSFSNADTLAIFIDDSSVSPPGVTVASTFDVERLGRLSRISIRLRPSLIIPDCWKVSRIRLTTSRLVPSSSASI